MSSGPLAVRDDLFGFVNAFLTPRQGADDNTNPKPPGAEPQNAAPGPQPAAVPDAVPQPTGVRAIPEGSVSPVASPGLQPGDDAVLTGSWAWRMMMAQQEQRRKEAEAARGWDTAMSGLAGLASGATGGSYAAGQAGFGNAPRPGSSRETGSDAFTLEELRQFGDDATKLKTQAANQANVAAFKKAHPEMNPADIDAAVAGGDYGQLRTLGLSLTDPQKRAEASSAQERVAKEKEFRMIMSDPALAARVMAATGITDPVMLRAAFDSGKLDDVIANAAKGTSLYQDWLKTDQKKSFTQWAEEERSSKATQPAPGKGLWDAQVTRINTAIDISDKQRNGMTTNLQAYRMLNDPNNPVYQGAFWGNETLQHGLSFVMDAMGKQVEGITNAQQLKSYLGEQIVQNAKVFGGQPSEGERAALERVIAPNGTVNKEAVLEIVRGNLRRQTQAQLDTRREVEQGLRVFQDPYSQSMLKEKLNQLNAALPDVSRELFAPGVIDATRASLASAETPEQRQALEKEFDKRYGAGWFRYATEQPGGP